MKILLDTHALLWWFADDPRLSAVARSMIASAESEIWVSAASAWEISTKARIGKLSGTERLLAEFDKWLLQAGFQQLNMTHRHAILAGGFKVEHRDPFDRMLVAQAMTERMILLSNDAALAVFDVSLAW